MHSFLIKIAQQGRTCICALRLTIHEPQITSHGLEFYRLNYWQGTLFVKAKMAEKHSIFCIIKFHCKIGQLLITCAQISQADAVRNGLQVQTYNGLCDVDRLL